MNWDNEDNNYTCPVCNSEDCVPPSGPKNSNVLVVGEFPGAEEIKTGKPFVGPTGRIFATEVRKIGFDPQGFRVCNLWQHEKPNAKEKTYAECLQKGIETVIHEAKGKKIVLLAGSDVVDVFCKVSVMDVNGLLVKPRYISVPIVIASVNPAWVFKNGLGELRFALQTLAKYLEEL